MDARRTLLIGTLTPRSHGDLESVLAREAQRSTCDLVELRLDFGRIGRESSRRLGLTGQPTTPQQAADQHGR